ncbi:MAG: 2-amino-4-hydroxy-6-hydroxymethyldihydropteridine diphosphokinase [Acetobacteraceae bacterium]
MEDGKAILIAIGANLPGPDGRSPLANCQAAATVLDGTRGLRLVALSRWWLSAPIPPSCQPDYVNGVAKLAGEMEPAVLLGALQAMERAAGGRPGGRNAARPLDLDIIAMGALRRRAPDPVLPHPRAHLRAFVLAPLAEVAPGWIHPEIGRTVEALLAELPAQRLCPLEIAGDLACRG